MKSNYSLIILLLISATTYAQEIYQWRGENRDGVYNEKKLLKEWPENGPKVLWVNENIGDGYGAVTVAKEMIFVNGKIDSSSYVLALDLKGNIIWKATNGKGFIGKGYAANFPGSRSAPTIVDNLVYACSGEGRIVCLDKLSGEEKWSVDMAKDFGGIMGQHGYSESLLTDDSVLFCGPGGPEINIAALNRFTGETIWTSKALSDTTSYCSPIIIKLPARKILVTFSGHDLLGLDAKTGELLWSESQAYHRWHQQCNTPIYENGSLFYVAGEGNGAVKLELTEDGENIKQVWRNSQIKNVFGGFLLKDNQLFSPEKTKLKCLDKNTGEVTDSLRVKGGSLIFADGMMYQYSDNGYINLIKSSGSEMKVVSKFKCDKGTKEHFAHPVISNGILYIRHGKALIAYDIKESE